MISPLALLLLCAVGLVASGILAIRLARLPGSGKFVYGASAAFCLVTLVLALVALLSGAPPARLVLPLGLPWIGAHFRLDALSAFFLVIVDLGGLAASLFGIGYAKKPDQGRVLPFFPTFLAGMNLVVLADDAFSFLVAWEAMSLASWALVLAHHKADEARRAGFVYLLMAGFGTLMLLLAFGLLAGADGGFAFDAMRAAAHPPAIAALALVLALLGAGSKAGLVPLHVWLPLAHPAAPSHVSALMSGVMTKVAVYAFLRIAFDLLGAPDWWAGLLVIALGALTAVYAILSALMEADIKRLLAYSTIENVGIVFLALGLAMAFSADGMAVPAALALAAGLFHAFNHSLIKSLLFFGAGAVEAATGTRDLDRLGGLIHRMPITSGLFLVGAAAIAALPPLNGFASEWLILQTVLTGPELPQWALKLAVPASGGMLALAAALSAATFVKAFGIGFLGRPRSDAAAMATEPVPLMRQAMAGLAGLCLLFGLLPGLAVRALAPVGALLLGPGAPASGANPGLGPVVAGGGAYDALAIAVLAALFIGLALLVLRRLGPSGRRRAPAWACGLPALTPTMQYSAGGFSQPLRRVLGSAAFAAHERIALPAPGETESARLDLRLLDLAWGGLYAPLAQAVAGLADRLNVLQFLTIRRYLGIVFGLLVILLMAVAIWR